MNEISRRKNVQALLSRVSFESEIFMPPKSLGGKFKGLYLLQETVFTRSRNFNRETFRYECFSVGSFALSFITL